MFVIVICVLFQDRFLVCCRQRAALSLIESSSRFFSARRTRALYVSCRWLLYNSVLFATSIRAQCGKASLKIKNNKHMSEKAQRADISITRNSSVHQHWSDKQQKRFAALEILSISVFSFSIIILVKFI